MPEEYRAVGATAAHQTFVLRVPGHNARLLLVAAECLHVGIHIPDVVQLD